MALSVAKLAVLYVASVACFVAIGALAVQEVPEVQVNVPVDLTKFEVRLTRVEETGKDLINFRGINVSYVSPITLGSPPKKFDAIFSTKSKVTLVPYQFHESIFSFVTNSGGYQCKESTKCKRKNFNFFLPTSSGANFNVSTYTDVFGVQGTMTKKPTDQQEQREQKQLNFWHHFGGVKNQLQSKYIHVALAPVSAHNCKTLLESIVGEQNDQILLQSSPEERQPIAQMFSVEFSPDAKEMYMTFGQQARFVGLVNETHIPLSSDLDWRIKMQPFYFKNRRLCANDDCNAVLNTASDSIVGPANIVSEIYDELGAIFDTDTKLYTVDCSKIVDFPNLTFNFVGERRGDTIAVTLKPRQYTKVFKPNERIYCYLDIKPAASNVKDWQLGTSFLARVLSIFDVKNKRVSMLVK